jgi:hypothetical protein
MTLGMCECGQTRLVERNVPVFADSPQEQVNPTGFFDCFFVGFAFLDQIGRVAVEDVYVFGINVD